MKKKPNEDKKLYEKFTLQGFIALSLWSFLFWVQGLLMFDLFIGIEFLELTWSFKSIVKFYLIVWVVLFFFGCLLPKLADLIKSKQ